MHLTLRTMRRSGPPESEGAWVAASATWSACCSSASAKAWVSDLGKMLPERIKSCTAWLPRVCRNWFKGAGELVG